MDNLPDRFRSRNGLTGSSGRLPVRVERAARDAVFGQYVRAEAELAQVRRVQSVVEAGLHAAEDITNLEALALMSNPMGEQRYKLIADQGAMGIARIVAEAGRD